MTNPKGTWAETKLVNWAHAHGYPGADRLPKRGRRDTGDVALCPGLIVECKNFNGQASLGQPTPLQLAGWMRQAEVERTNADADLCLLVVKRAGTTDPGRWWAFLPAWSLAALLGAADAPPALDAPVCMSVADMTALTRAAGYGTPLEPETGDAA